ncbi:hypothetical protein CY34DRAFT_814375, partial [Suillus luteus UH-Slu-Lm8-n1]
MAQTSENAVAVNCQGTHQRESEQDHCQKRTSLSYVTGHWYIILTFSTERNFWILKELFS